MGQSSFSGNNKHGGQMVADSSGHEDGQRMLDLFASVGATQFDVTWTTCAGDKELFRRNVPLAELERQLPGMLGYAPTKQRNVIVRPHGANVTFIQLDDLKADRLPALAQVMFLALETSPGNYQAWVALSGNEDKDFARRLRKGVGADPTASGATRVAGSLNFKDKYAPNFPRVAIHAAQPGRLAYGRRARTPRARGSARTRRPAASHSCAPDFRQPVVAELHALPRWRAAQ